MKIIYWADFNCPYSYIGIKRIKKVVSNLDISPEFKMKAFELENIDFDVSEVENCEDIDFNLEGKTFTSTKDAHRLVKFCQKKHSDAAEDIIEDIFKANFCENKDISDYDELIRIVAPYGINKTAVKNLLDSDAYEIEVMLDRDDALFNGITAIPCFLIYVDDGRLLIPGTFPEEELTTAFKDLLSGRIKEKTYGFTTKLI